MLYCLSTANAIQLASACLLSPAAHCLQEGLGFSLNPKNVLHAGEKSGAKATECVVAAPAPAASSAGLDVTTRWPQERAQEV